MGQDLGIRSYSGPMALLATPSNYWMTPSCNGQPSTPSGSSSTNRMIATPMMLGVAATLNAVALIVTSGGSGNIRLGIYAAGEDGRPDALVADWGTVTATAGLKTLTGLSTALMPGLYWLTYALQGTLACQVRAAGAYSVYVGSTGTPATTASRALFMSSVSGAFPSTFTPGGVTSAGAAFWVRFD